MKYALGQSVPRTEDPRLLRGEGRYVDDIHLPGETHAFVLRSPHAHARIKRLDTRAAGQMPGVVAVFTGADWAREDFGQHPPSYVRTRRDGSPLHIPPHPPLVATRAMFVGDYVALVVAETLDQARDAAERVEVDYETLPPVIDSATARGAPALWEGCADNECFFFTLGDKGAVDAAFARADHVTTLALTVNRITAATIEPRAVIGEYDRGGERYVLYAGTQRPHSLRRTLAGQVFKVPENRVRIVAPDVGGSFGMKGGHHPECHLAMWAARELGRPVRWVAERTEGMLSDYHDRDQVTEAELALDSAGKFLGLRVRNICNIGAYVDPGSMISPTGHLGGLAGLYTTPAIHVEVSAVFSNKAPIGPYRGSGRPEATYVLERLIDNAAREMGIDRAEIRARNLIPADAMPYKTGLTYTYDCGDFPANMKSVVAAGDYAGFEARRAEAAKHGRLRGIGIANFVEQTAQLDGETLGLQFDASGSVTVLAGSISHGQGHDTMYKIVISDRLGIDDGDIRVAYGDTDSLPFGGGTYASRTAILGGSAAAVASDHVIEKGMSIAAHLLEASETDIAFEDGDYRVAGTDRAVSIQEVARASYNPASLPPGAEIGLHDTTTYVAGVPTFPNGCHVCEVEIDPDTGKTEIIRYSVVDDVGTVINALTLDGQIHGGIGQAVGQAFTENIVYDDETGQMMTASFQDYGMPRADDMCSFDMQNNPVPTKTNPIGAKGAGEAGNVGGLGAIMNAVVDALSPLGIRHIDMPATPQRVWRAIRDAKAV
ncbi:MAG: xanthine dehydrogenase family protein molybdopterin-binding subunit [Alphaproteobacteria bacterium]